MHIHLNHTSFCCCPVSRTACRSPAAARLGFGDGWKELRKLRRCPRLSRYHCGFAYRLCSSVSPSVKCDGNADVSQWHALKLTSGKCSAVLKRLAIKTQAALLLSTAEHLLMYLGPADGLGASRLALGQRCWPGKCIHFLICGCY